MWHEHLESLPLDVVSARQRAVLQLVLLYFLRA